MRNLKHKWTVVDSNNRSIKYYLPLINKSVDLLFDTRKEAREFVSGSGVDGDKVKKVIFEVLY